MRTKEIQGALWSTAPADWARLFEPVFIPMYEGVLQQLKLDEEKMLLDAGCGSGLFLSMASSTGASIHGIDAAPGLLEISKERLQGVTLLTEDLEALPFIDGTFDVVTGFNSFQYAGSFVNALAEAKRVVKKHGRVVIGIWGKKEMCEASAILSAVGSLMPPPASGTPGPFALSEDGKIESICEPFGLKVINKQTVLCPMSYNCDEDLLKAFLCTAPCVKAVQIAGEEAVKQAIIESAQPLSVAEEVYYMKNYFTFFITHKS